MNPITKSRTYTRLLTQIRNEIDSARERIEQTKAQAYWRVGKYISEHKLSHNGKAGYGDKLMKKLSGDLAVGERVLYQSVQFYREYPKLHARAKLDWSHYRELLSIEEKYLRERFEQKAIAKNLSSRELAKEIKEAKSGLRSTKDQVPRTKLTPRKGALYTFTTFTPAEVFAVTGEVMADCGFNIWRRIKLREWPEVKFRKENGYAYRAYIEKVIDGDTLKAQVELGLGAFTRQKLRLRGIDCPEIGTKAGQRAKRYVQRVLKNVKMVTVVTSKADKYDRYLADIFYSSLRSQTHQDLAKQDGKDENFLNQDLLDKGLATAYKK